MLDNVPADLETNSGTGMVALNRVPFASNTCSAWTVSEPSVLRSVENSSNVLKFPDVCATKSKLASLILFAVEKGRVGCPPV
mgnify:CR=1 FL=1